MIGKEIRALPVISQLDAVESVVGERSRNFMKVENFLLSRSKALIGNFLKMTATVGHIVTLSDHFTSAESA
jgi:hypothetical protein